MDLTMQIKDQAVRRIAGAKGVKAVDKGALDGLRKAIAVVQKHHKRNEWIRSGGRLSSGGKKMQAPHPDKLTVRSGTLSKSYTSRIVKQALRAYYGSDVIYAPVHEFGSRKQNIPKRPGLERTIKAKGATIEKIMADAVGKKLDRA